jgi:ribose/xylose/arabinose/galactoside ABC-type transport system permease subunit
MTGDRAHPYDLLVKSGWSPTAASATYIAVEAVVVTTVAVIGTPSMAVAVAIDVAVAGVVLGGAALVGGFRDPAGTRP